MGESTLQPPSAAMPVADQLQITHTDSAIIPTEPQSTQDAEKQPAQDAIQEYKQYSAFSVNEKRAMVAVGSLAAFFSPLSSSIYFPALDTIANALNETTSRIDITVTTYLVSRLQVGILLKSISSYPSRI